MYNRKSLLCYPSFYAHVVSGIILFLAMIILFMNGEQLKTGNPYIFVIILLLFSIAAGIHSISHLFLETVHGYNPLIRKKPKGDF